MKIIRFFLFPFALLIDLLTTLCSGFLYYASFIFRLISTIIGLLGTVVLLTGKTQNGCILLFLAYLISPVGLPMIVVSILGLLQRISGAIKSL